MSEESMMEVNDVADSESENESQGCNWYDENDVDSYDEKLIEDSTESVFCFETDHAALIGNRDYHSLMKALAVLQVQRTKVVQDIEKLQHMRCKVKDNPKEYLRKFINGDASDIPSDIKIQTVPDIDWSKYKLKSSNSLTVNLTNEPQTSSQKIIISKNIKKENDNVMTGKDRTFDQTKSRSFHQLWTAEEQLRLEELLVQFPPEANENNRWRKIAQALGNRTTKQVCSRVQKYFKKLTKARLPIPGHQLKSRNTTSLKKKPRKRHSKKRERGSTFFPTQHLGADQVLECDDQKHTPQVVTQELKAEILEKVIEYKKKERAQLSPFSHPDIQCSVCEELPLQGTRWHCLVCPRVNLCSDCVISQLDAEPDCVAHSPLHPLEPMANTTTGNDHWDPDYLPDSFKTNNYLDPNYVSSNLLL